MALRLSAPRSGGLYTPQKRYFSASCTHFCYRLSIVRGLVRPQGLSKLIKIIHLIVSRTRDLPASYEKLGDTELY
jgi:hypothetical protein